jgi:predicted Zn finger-like uncharacterized protein
MSFITQCPACETQFKVAPDQLKVSEGWVRCGQCQHVFDASLNLQPWWPEPEPEAVPQPAAPAPDDSAWQDMPASADAQEPRFDMPEPNPHADVEAFPAESSYPHAEPPYSLAASNEAQESLEAASGDDTPIGATAATSSAAPAEASQPLPSFIQKAMEKAYWHRTSVRLTLYALIAVLLLVLGAQWFYRHKNEWAASHAQWRPALQAVCAVLQCQIEVPRKLSEVVIDSSSFVRGTANRFDFQLMLRNRADVEVAMPTLELTLTDLDNQVIARRLIPPTEWPEQPTSLGAQAVWPLRLELLLDMPPTQIVTGYQAELFYP